MSGFNSSQKLLGFLRKSLSPTKSGKKGNRSAERRGPQFEIEEYDFARRLTSGGGSPPFSNQKQEQKKKKSTEEKKSRDALQEADREDEEDDFEQVLEEVYLHHLPVPV